MDETKQAVGSPDYRHEPDVLQAHNVVLFGIGLLIMIGVVLVLMNWMFR